MDNYILDLLFLVIICLSALISIIRGFFIEVVSLLTWAAALVISTLFAHKFGLLFKAHIEDDVARGQLAWILLFLGTLLIGGLINFLASKLRQDKSLTPMDRTVGFFFGLLRGVILASLVVLVAHLATFSSIRDSQLWNNSVSVGYFEGIAGVMASALPPELAKHFDFGSAS